MIVYMLFWIFCLQISHAEEFSSVSAEKIFGGSLVDINESPWTASVHEIVASGGTKFLCSGSIITQTAVITTRFCITNFRTADFKVRLGSTSVYNGGQFYSVINNATRYYSPWPENSIALLQLEKTIILGPAAYPIALPNKNQGVPYGSNCEITGFGMTSPTVLPTKLNKMNTEIWPDLEMCEEYSEYFADNIFCAGGIGEMSPCRFDDGSPVVVDEVLVGITIFPDGCIFNKVSTFLSISSQVEWIEKIIKSNFSNEVDQLQ